MKYAGKTFTLYASEPVAVQGSDSLYTYQNTGTGTATLQGSNTGKDWITITTVASGASYIGSHSYAFLQMTGSTEVSVSRGITGSGTSSSNPLPVTKISDASATATVGNTAIAVGGTSQVVFTAKTRKGYWVKNTSSADLNINRGGGTATSSNFAIPAGAYFETPVWENVSTKIEIYGATTGQTFQYGECV